MIVLFDLGATFWYYYFAQLSAVDAYSNTLDRIDWYAKSNPGRFVVCCDHPVLKRKQMDPTYKAQRKEKPRDGVDALTSVEERAREWGLPVVKLEGFEGDDIVSTLCAQAWPETVQIVGTEKDFYALLADNVTLVGRQGTIDESDCMRKFGCAPSQMTDYLALCGDYADGVKGCPNCGPDRSARLLERFGTIARIKAATDDELKELKGIGEKTRASLREWDPTQALSLVRLMTDAPVNLWELLGGSHE